MCSSDPKQEAEEAGKVYGCRGCLLVAEGLQILGLL